MVSWKNGSGEKSFGLFSYPFLWLRLSRPFLMLGRKEMIEVPRKPRKPCSYPGCPNLTENRYCEEHAAKANREYDLYVRAPDKHKKYGRAWKRIRDSYAREHPLCERCLEEGRVSLMDEVHHIVPVSQGGTHARSNLRSLCRSCHQRTHQELGDR